MNLQTIKSINGQNEYVLLPIDAYNVLKKQIDKVLNEEYESFDLQEYVQNPVALARIRAGITQKTLANHLKVSQAYISKIESQDSVSPKLLARVKKMIVLLSQKPNRSN